MSLRRSFSSCETPARSRNQPAARTTRSATPSQPMIGYMPPISFLKPISEAAYPSATTPTRTMRMRFVDPPEKRRAVAKKSEKTVL